MAFCSNFLTRLKFRLVTNVFGLLTSLTLLLPAFLSAQVVVIPSTPTYNIQVLPGSTRQINVNITNGSLNTINWSVLSTTGGASASFTTPAVTAASTIASGLPTVQVNIGAVAGNCTIPQPPTSMGAYSVTSTATVTVQAQSVDDPTKSGKFLFNVCAKTTTVMIAPAYQQAFMGQHRTLQSWISGDTDETGTWSIVTQPGGGNAVLADTTNRDTDFLATVTGRYTLKYTSNSNPLKSATAIVYVSPNPLPAYASTPNKTEPRECHVDPAFTGGDYEVGAGKQYPTLSSTPAANTLAPGSIIRIWNTDTTGMNPSTYHEYYQVAASGTPTQPMILCGMPDALGNLPVIDGSNATGQAGISTGGAAAGAGIISLWGGGFNNGTPYGYWQNGSAGPSYATVTGLHIVHGTPDYNYTPPGGGAATPYETFTSCLNIRSGSYIDLGGNNMDTCGLGVFTADNGNNGWVSITQLVTITGNHVQNAGISQQFGEHEAYVQSWYALVQGNLWDNYNKQAFGSAIKWRGVEGIFRYNNVASGAQRLFDLVEVQDATPYVSFEGYLSFPGDTNCDNSFYCLGDKAGANIVAAYQESLQKDFIYGNEMFGLSSLQQVHYLADGGSGMEDRNGTLYFFSNTLDAAQNIFDNSSNGDGFYGYFPQRVDARNNIFWANHAPYSGAEIQMSFATESTIVMSATTNLMNADTFSIQTPIEGALWANNTEEAWSNTCDGPCQWPLTMPLDAHLYGLTSANFLSTATQPYDSNTMVPPAGSAAINAGSALTGILETMPVRWQYSVATNSLIPRLNPQTIGAVDFAPEAIAPTFSPSAGDYTTALTVNMETTTPSATIYYTTDGSMPTYPMSGTTKLYNGQITVAATETVQAIAIATGYVQSNVASAAFGVGPMAAIPSLSPVGGTYTAVQTVTISDSTQGATIYYTIDGTTPTTDSPVYSGPITVSVNESVQAIAAAPGYSNSNVGFAGYVINIPQTVTPTFTPAAGSYTATQTVTIGDATPGALIYYTTNGSTPTAASTLYNGPITVAGSQVVEAIAIGAGDSPSAAGMAAYSITLPFTGPVVVQQCNNFVQFGNSISCTLNAVGAGHTLVIGIANLASGQAGTITASSGVPALAITDGNMLSAWVLPNTSAGSNTITYSLGSSSRIWLSVVEFENTTASPLDGVAQANLSTSWQGSGFLNTPNFTTSTASDILWSFCSGSQGIPTVGTAPAAWSGLPSPASGSLLVETANANTPGSYYGQCSGNEGEIISLALMPAAVMVQSPSPSFNVASGTYTTNQTVTIFDATPGATIYYTTNGTAPSPASNVYSGPITVSSTETVQAIATSSTTTQSPAASAAYIINPLATAPPIIWITPAAIPYGTALSAAQLNATATVAGTFTYSPALGSILTAGNQTLTVTFTATDATDFVTATDSVTLMVNQAIPAITWNSPAAIGYGTPVSANQLNATSSIAGSFSYSPAAGTVLSGGSQALTVTFTPTDMTDYSATTASTVLTVTPIAPPITWATPAAITYGTSLCPVQLNATSTITGTYSYFPAAGSVPTAGSKALTVIFTPTGTTNYSTTTTSVTLTVARATPPINWATPAAIANGTPLSSTQLDATSTVAGSFTYSPAAGTLLATGLQNLTATFTPTDTTDYSSATAPVTLTVLPPPAAPYFVQQCNQFVQLGATATCTLKGVGAGHTLMIGIAGGGATQSGKVTASVGTPTLAVKDGSLLSAYVLANTSVGNITITFTVTANTRIWLTVAEYANTAASPLDGTASFVEPGYGNTISTPKFTTTISTDLVWSYCVVPGGYALTPGKAPVLFTPRTSPVGSGYVTLVEDGLTTTPGSYFGQCGGPGTAWEIVTVALKN
jgi:hypothetical protein